MRRVTITLVVAVLIGAGCSGAGSNTEDDNGGTATTSEPPVETQGAFHITLLVEETSGQIVDGILESGPGRALAPRSMRFDLDEGADYAYGVFEGQAESAEVECREALWVDGQGYERSSVADDRTTAFVPSDVRRPFDEVGFELPLSLDSLGVDHDLTPGDTRSVELDRAGLRALEEAVALPARLSDYESGTLTVTSDSSGSVRVLVADAVYETVSVDGLPPEAGSIHVELNIDALPDDGRVSTNSTVAEAGGCAA